MAEMSQAAEASTQANAEHTAVYEVGFHVVPTVAEGEVGAVAAKIREALGSAEIIKEEAPHKLALAYTIERSVQGKREKYSEAYFGFTKFATEPENVPAIEAALRGMREVLRFIIVEALREDDAPQRAVFGSDRLEGQTLKKPTAAPEERGEVSEEELNKSLESLTQ